MHARLRRPAPAGLGCVRPAGRAARDRDRTASRGTTANNIATFKRQLKMLGFSYDWWSREIDATDPGYVHWTQWILLQRAVRALLLGIDVLLIVESVFRWEPAGVPAWPLVRAAVG